MRLAFFALLAASLIAACSSSSATPNQPAPPTPQNPADAHGNDPGQVAPASPADPFSGQWVGTCKVTSPDHSHDQDACQMALVISIDDDTLSSQIMLQINGTDYSGEEQSFLIQGGKLRLMALNVGSITANSFTIHDSDSNVTFTLSSDSAAVFSKTDTLSGVQITSVLQRPGN